MMNYVYLPSKLSSSTEKERDMIVARTGENIYKRKDGRWEARFIYSYDSTGKAKYRSVYGINRQEAKLKRLQIVHELMLGMEIQATPNIFFKDLAKNWLINTKLRVKESTYARYYSQVQKHVLPYLGRYQILKMNTELIEQLIGRLLKSTDQGGLGLSPKTVEDILIIIKSILKFSKYHANLELHRIRIKKEDKKPLTLTKTAQLKLNQYLVDEPNCIKAGILMSLHTGIRIGELCALRWDNIDLDEQMIHIEKTLQRIQISAEECAASKTKVVISSPKSKKSIRDIYIPNFLTEILRELKGQQSSYLLTGNSRYMEPRNLYNHYKKCLTLCGVANYNFHSLRHTFATNYVESGYDVKSLSEILGHSDVKITLERYVHSSNDLKRNNMENMVGFLLHKPSKFPSL